MPEHVKSAQKCWWVQTQLMQKNEDTKRKEMHMQRQNTTAVQLFKADRHMNTGCCTD